MQQYDLLFQADVLVFPESFCFVTAAIVHTDFEIVRFY